MPGLRRNGITTSVLAARLRPVRTRTRPSIPLAAPVQRDNPGLSREWLDGLYDYSRPLATRRAVLRLYRATPPDVTDR